MLKSMTVGGMLRMFSPAKLAGTASTGMLQAVRVELADMTTLSVASALPWSILSGRLDREELMLLLKRMVG